MVKKIFLIIPIFLFSNVFKSNCLKCHKNYELKLYIANYTLKYSSEKRIKKAIFNFLKSPTSYKSIMPPSYIIKHEYKKPTTLDDKKLKEAIDIYYQKFNLKQFIK